MRWDYGTVYKEIRKSKHLTQEQVCSGVIDRTTLVKFERNKSIPHYETMRFLLHQLDMCFDEFEYICNGYKKDHDELLIRKIDLLMANTSSDYLKILIKEGQKELAHSPNLPLEYRLDMLKIVVAIREEGVHNQSDVTRTLTEKIWKRLESYETWYKNDFRQLTTILYHFSPETLPDLADLILERMEKYEDFKEIQGTRLVFLCHLSYLFLNYRNSSQCQRFASLLIAEAKKGKRYDFFAKGYIYLGLCQNDKGLVEKGIRILEDTEEEGLLMAMRETIVDYQ